MKLKNYYQPTPIFWRKIGDTILLGSASLSTLMMGAPINDHAKTWIVFGINAFGIMGKLITNFFKDDNDEKPKDDEQI